MAALMRPVQPILIADRFLDLHEELTALLRGLAAEDWSRPTMSTHWSVKDVAAHLLDTDLRRLSCQRDSYVPDGFAGGIESGEGLTRFLNRLNEEWVAVAKRLSPAILIEMIEVSGRGVAALFESLDPLAEAIFPVSWAGQDVSPNWLDVAREFTEKWIHQAQIREAVERDGLTDRRFLHPVRQSPLLCARRGSDRLAQRAWQTPPALVHRNCRHAGRSCADIGPDLDLGVKLCRQGGYS